MIEKKDIQKMVNHVVKRDRGIADKRLLHPKREWSVAVIIGLLIFMYGLYFAGKYYEQFTSLRVDAVEVDVEKLQYERGDVLEALDHYGKKDAQYKELVGEIEANPVAVPVADEEQDAEQADDISEDTVNLVKIRFPEKLVYTDNMNEFAEDDLRNHCEAEGGTFNTCGSVCPSTADVCTEQCAYTCEFREEEEEVVDEEETAEVIEEVLLDEVGEPVE